MTRPRGSRIGRKLVVGVLVAGLVPLVLGLGLLGWRSSHEADERAQLTAREEANAGASALSRLLHDLRFQLLLAADNRAYSQWYSDQRQQDELRPVIESSLVLLYQLQPGLIDEACFIDAAGPEQARMVQGQPAPLADLSPDESMNPFFGPTFQQDLGQVYQQGPYVSMDSGRWVIPTSTPIEVDGAKVAILHFEVSFEGMREMLHETLGHDVEFRVLDADGNVLMDGSNPAEIVDAPFQPAGAWPAGSKVSSMQLTDAQGDIADWRVEVAVAPASLLASTHLVALMLLCLLAGTLLVVGAILFARRIVRPLERTAWAAKGLADGDLTRRANLARDDEVGNVGAELDAAAARIGVAMSGIAQNADRLSEAASDLSRANAAMAEVAARSAETSAAASGEAASVSEHVSTVVERSDRLGASAEAVAGSAGDALRVAAEAVSAIGDAALVTQRLNESSNEIGAVVTLIESIAEQTHLLALNATIEAARAGDLGKGFAVVAGEVKALALETREGLEQIRERIDAIRTDAAESQQANERAAVTVSQIEARQREISDAIEDQVRIVHEMRQALSQASERTGSITDHLGTVSAAASEATLEADLVRSSAEQLEAMAVALRTLIGHFHFEREAAGAPSDRHAAPPEGPAPRERAYAGSVAD
jgi:methyl-accepting chemotaxis protein